jgi:hypothetical protein
LEIGIIFQALSFLNPMQKVADDLICAHCKIGDLQHV